MRPSDPSDPSVRCVRKAARPPSPFVLTLLPAAILLFASAPQAEIFTVTNADTSGPGSFTAAVESANAAEGFDTINFALPEELCMENGVCRMRLSGGSFPAITDALLIDGTTQPRYGSAPLNVCAQDEAPSYMRIEFFSYLTVQLSIQSTGASTIRGLSFVRPDPGGSPYGGPIFISTAGPHRIQCNHFNLDGEGKNTGHPDGYGYGVVIQTTSEGAIIGTDGDGVDDVKERNVFGPCTIGGAFVNDNGGTVIAGNYFGLEADGVTPAAGSAPGIHIRQYSADNRIGSNLDGLADDRERNVIAHSRTGIRLDIRDSISQNNQIVGNWIGIDAMRNPAGNEIGIELTGYLSPGDDNQIIKQNIIANNEIGIYIDDDISLAEDSSYDNCFHDNLVAVEHDGSDQIDLVGNWWGRASGPSGEGGGSGDAIVVPGSGSVIYHPWLTQPVGGVACPVPEPGRPLLTCAALSVLFFIRRRAGWAESSGPQSISRKTESATRLRPDLAAARSAWGGCANR